MGPTELSYPELAESFLTKIKENRLCVLATSKDNYVRAGSMGYASNGFDLYCFSGVNTRKCRQIEANSNVAIVIQNLQLEGTASIGKHPLEEPEFLKIYKASYPDSFDAHSKRYFEASTDMRVIKIKVNRGTAFIPQDPPILQILDLKSKKAYLIDANYPEDTPVYKG